VGNAGGIRIKTSPDGCVERMVVLTSVATARIKGENPYHDRVEGDVLVYTGAGQEGHQTLAGNNRRIPDQITGFFPVYCFLLVGSRRDKQIGTKRWRFLGLLRYLRHYKETKVDARANPRDAWVVEFRIHDDFKIISPKNDMALMRGFLLADGESSGEDDRILAPSSSAISSPAVAKPDPIELERLRCRMFSLAPEAFEHLIKDVLLLCGFLRVTVTQYSQDGGIDVNAFVGESIWPLKNLLVQLQAKRWLHTVGRREIAELRGSLQPHARGAVVTTSHFSRAEQAVGQVAPISRGSSTDDHPLEPSPSVEQLRKFALDALPNDKHPRELLSGAWDEAFVKQIAISILDSCESYAQQAALMYILAFLAHGDSPTGKLAIEQFDMIYKSVVAKPITKVSASLWGLALGSA